MYDAQLLGFVAHVGALLNFLGGLAYCQFYDNGVFQQGLGQVFNLVGHGGREHDGLAGGRQQLCYLFNVFRETHVEHAVGLVEDEERHLAEVGVTHADVADEASWGGYHHVGAQCQAFQFLVVTVAVVATIDGHAAHVVQIIAEALHGLVYLLCQLACGAHDNAVDGVFRVSALVELAQHGQQVGCRFSGSCLGHAQHVFTGQYFGYALLLYGRACLEAHVVERIEHVVV